MAGIIRQVIEIKFHEQGGWPGCDQVMHLPHSLPERIEKIHNSSTAALFITNKSGLSFCHTFFQFAAPLAFLNLILPHLPPSITFL